MSQRDNAISMLPHYNIINSLITVPLKDQINDDHCLLRLSGFFGWSYEYKIWSGVVLLGSLADNRGSSRWLEGLPL